MPSAIELNTLLRQRYLIKQLLGQGGFGRTYLALDQERFNELCVLKEFTVSYQDEILVKKAKALFQREASILHQVQHPQIPRFWAAFEWEQRLFLVQDYIQGQTYRHLLQARRDCGASFHEAEVLHLLHHLLPVLSYLHDLNIIHRDISPENLVLRPWNDQKQLNATADYRTGLPILIDFGSVKEATSGLALVSSMTRVGKVGYAPPEQLQTGNVHPHSDLYALAATCLVLMTGREPHILLDSFTLDWHWHPYAQISPSLAAILNRMLALHPADRYPSAREVEASLQQLSKGDLPLTQLTGRTHAERGASVACPQNPVVHPEASPVNGAPARPSRLARDYPGQWVATLLPRSWGGQRESIGKLAPPRKFWRSIWPWKSPPTLVAMIGCLLMGGLGAVIWHGALPVSQQAVRMPSSPPVQPSSSPDANLGQPQSIEFRPGEIAAVMQGNLQANQMQLYTLQARKGQIMSVMLEGAGVMMNLRRANQELMDAAAHQTRSWTGQLPETETYQIQVIGSGAYWLDVTITPTGQPESALPQPVKFDQGNQTTVTGEIAPQQVQRYSVEAKRGQILKIKLLQGAISLRTVDPNGRTLGTTASVWQTKALLSGSYTVEVSAQEREDYALSFQLK
jgi:serine/threonine-protein kinase